MPTTTQHDELAEAQGAAHSAYEEFRDSHEIENAWAAHVADELLIVAARLELPETLARALDHYRSQRDATAPLRARWTEASERARQLYAAMYPADRALSDPSGTVVPLDT